MIDIIQFCMLKIFRIVKIPEKSFILEREFNYSRNLILETIIRSSLNLSEDKYQK